MYQRSYPRTGYSVPPGYMGSAFATEPEVKHHPPNKTDENTRDMSNASNGRVGERSENRAVFGELLSSLKGKIGTEELLLLLVMLLTSEGGVGIETLLLGLVLLAGR